MNASEIKALIDKYQIVKVNGKIGTYAKVDKAAFMRDVPPFKTEILQYFEDQERAEAERRERRKNTFESIPGVKEIRDVRRRSYEWHKELNRMCDSGDSRFNSRVVLPSEEEVAHLKEQYPMAIFALEAENRVCSTTNYRLAKIWRDTYDAICDGADIATVKAEHDAKMDEYTKSIMGE